MGTSGDVDEHRVTAVLLRNQAVLGELSAHLVRIGFRLVDLVDGHDDRHIGSLGVVQRLNGLRHDAVISSNNQHRDVGGLGATSTHGREGLVTRGVDEGDGALDVVDLGLDLVSTDGLGDATGLALHHMSVTQGVQQLRLAVVDVAHHGDDRWTCDEILLIALVLAELKVEGLQQLAILVLRGHDLNVIVELAAQDLQGVVGHRLGGSHHLAKVEQHLHELRRLGIDLLGEIGQRGTTTQSDGLTIALADAHTADQRRLHLVELLPALLAGLATTTGTTTAKGRDHRDHRRRDREVLRRSHRRNRRHGIHRDHGHRRVHHDQYLPDQSGRTGASASWPGSDEAYRNRHAIPGCRPDAAYARPDLNEELHRCAARPQGDDGTGPFPGWRRTGCSRDAGFRYDDQHPDADRGEHPTAARRIPPGAGPDGHPASGWQAWPTHQAWGRGSVHGAWRRSDQAWEPAWRRSSVPGSPASWSHRKTS